MISSYCNHKQLFTFEPLFLACLWTILPLKLEEQWTIYVCLFLHVLLFWLLTIHHQIFNIINISLILSKRGILVLKVLWMEEFKVGNSCSYCFAFYFGSQNLLFTLFVWLICGCKKLKTCFDQGRTGRVLESVFYLFGIKICHSYFVLGVPNILQNHNYGNEIFPCCYPHYLLIKHIFHLIRAIQMAIKQIFYLRNLLQTKYLLINDTEHWTGSQRGNDPP